ncbi:MAG: hypothetical protein WD472_11300 [Dehalococcoidia bacterium]
MNEPATKPPLTVVGNTPQRGTTAKQAARKKAPGKSVRAKKAPAEPATRPILLESEVYRREQERLLNEVNGKIEGVIAAEQRAEADYQEAVTLLTRAREAERAAQAHRKADLLRIHDGCTAALNASESQEPVATGVVINSSEGSAGQ